MRLKIWFVLLTFFGGTLAQACTSIVLNGTDNGRVGGGVNSYEFTEWTVVANIETKTYNIRSFENPGVLSIGFTEADMNSKTLRSIPLLK